MKRDIWQKSNMIFEGVSKSGSNRYVHGDVFHFAAIFLDLLRKQGIALSPVDEAQLKEAEDELNFLERTQKVNTGYFTLDDNWHKSDIGSFIGFYTDGSGEVLVERDGERYYFTDCVNDTKEPVTDDNFSRIENKGLFVFHIISARNIITLLFKSFMEERRELLKYILYTIIAATAALSIPLCIKYITDVALHINDFKNIVVIFLTMILTIISITLCNLVVNRIKVRMQIKIRARVFPTIMGRIFTLKSRDEKEVSRPLINTFLVFVESIDGIVSAVMGIMVYFLYSVVAFIGLYALKEDASPQITVSILIYLVFVFVLFFNVYNITVRSRENEAKLSGMRKELIDRIDVIKNNAIEDRLYYRYAIQYDTYMKDRIKLDYLLQVPGILQTVLGGVCYLAVFAYIAFVDYSGEGGSDMIMLASSLGLLMSYVSSLVASIAEMVNNIPNLKIADAILEKEQERDDGIGTDYQIEGKISVDNLYFSYDGSSNYILKEVSFQIEPGEYVAIVGASGSGKSTLVRLLLGYETPTSGHVFYDDIDIEQYDLHALRKSFGVVMQNEGVLNANIRTNIGMSEEADITRVKEAARLAAIEDEIEAMPMKYNTLLSSESELVSGGQKQRIVLARALYTKPRVIILDEATSALDNVSQEIVKRNLDSIGVTRVVIAHRLSTITKCDKIIVLDKGTVAECGTYQELMEKDGLFASLAKRNIV